MNQKEVSIKLILFTSIFFFSVSVFAQESHGVEYERDTLITAAREMMIKARYCALITLDESGHPQVRTMDPFVPEEDMVVWMGTNPDSRKVREIKNDSRVTLYYEDKDRGGYVVIRGSAEIVDDHELKLKYWKEGWNRFYEDKRTSYTLIKVIPTDLEVIDYQRGIVGEAKTWAVPRVGF
jgi:general stress protein 26